MEATAFGELESPIEQFYAKRSVFITGGTGFIGKILVEKLLRCCPDIKMLYLLIRTKKGKSPKERLQILLDKQCFDPIKEKFPSFKEKIAVVTGDVVQPQCGISSEDMKAIQRDVSVVFHSAAKVHFFDTLRNAVQENVIGTRNVLELSKELPHLEAFVHLSTAFARREPDYTVPEEIGGCHLHPNDVFSLLKTLDDESLKKITPSIVKEKRTTYQLSKALAEVVLEEEKGHVPLSVVRPCIVCPTWKEPLKGWCDIYQGISGLFAAASKGFLRAAYAPAGYRVLIVPADVVVNCMIASAWYTVTTRPESTFVVNCAMKYEDFPVREELLSVALNLREVCPISSIYRYPDFKVFENKVLYKAYATVDQYIPGIIIDGLLLIFTGKTLMIPLYRRIESVLNIFEEQGITPWYFCRDNFDKIKDALSPKDTEVFFIDMETLKWEDYLLNAGLGGRKFLVNEDPSTIPYALKKVRIWWLVTTILKWLFIFFFVYCVIPESLLHSARENLPSFLYASNPALSISPDAMNSAEKLDTNVRI